MPLCVAMRRWLEHPVGTTTGSCGGRSAGLSNSLRESESANCIQAVEADSHSCGDADRLAEVAAQEPWRWVRLRPVGMA